MNRYFFRKIFKNLLSCLLACGFIAAALSCPPKAYMAEVLDILENDRCEIYINRPEGKKQYNIFPAGKEEREKLIKWASDLKPFAAHHRNAAENEVIPDFEVFYGHYKVRFLRLDGAVAVIYDYEAIENILTQNLWIYCEV